MPVTGRAFVPNVPGSLEEALAGATAAGTSPWAPVMMMNARHERQQAIDNVNATQSELMMTQLAQALNIAHIQAGGNIYGQMARGGHMGGAMMQAANTAGYTDFDSNDIQAERLLGQSGELANTGKAINEANKAGAEAGVRTDLSRLATGLGFPTINSTPIATEGHEIAAGATLGAAQINAAAKDRATQAKTNSPTKKGGGPTLEWQGTGPLGGSPVIKGLPVNHDTLSRFFGEDTAKKLETDPVNAVAPDLTGTSSVAPSGDSIERDPELPHILAAVAKSGVQLVGSNGNARYSTNKKGQRVVVTDVILPDGRHTTSETPTTKQ